MRTLRARDFALCIGGPSDGTRLSTNSFTLPDGTLREHIQLPVPNKVYDSPIPINSVAGSLMIESAADYYLHKFYFNMGMRAPREFIFYTHKPLPDDVAENYCVLCRLFDRYPNPEDR